MTPEPKTPDTPRPAEFTSLDWGGAGALSVTTGPPLWPRSDGTWGRDMDARYDSEREADRLRRIASGQE